MATPALARVQSGRVRLIALNYRKPGLSQSEFETYWQNEHATVFSGMQVAKDNLLKYEQVSWAVFEPTCSRLDVVLM